LLAIETCDEGHCNGIFQYMIENQPPMAINGGNIVDTVELSIEACWNPPTHQKRKQWLQVVLRRIPAAQIAGADKKYQGRLSPGGENIDRKSFGKKSPPAGSDKRH